MENTQSSVAEAEAQGQARVRKPDRNQVLMRVECDDDLIPQQHQARVI